MTRRLTVLAVVFVLASASSFGAICRLVCAPTASEAAASSHGCHEDGSSPDERMTSRSHACDHDDDQQSSVVLTEAGSLVMPPVPAVPPDSSHDSKQLHEVLASSAGPPPFSPLLLQLRI